MATVNLGKIKPLYKGAYSSTVTYNALDFIKYTGVLYVAKTTSLNNLPTDAAFFDVVAPSQTPAEILTNLLTVDGAGSGLDADLLDGQSSAFYQNAANIVNVAEGNIAATTVQAAINELDVEKALLAGAAAQVFSVAPATAAGHAVSASVLQAQTNVAFTTGGTLTAYTLTPSPAIAAYAAGQSFFVTFALASGLNPTLTISGITTPPNLIKAVSAGTYANVIAGDIAANWRSRVTLLSATQALVEVLPDASRATPSTSVVKQFFPTF